MTKQLNIDELYALSDRAIDSSSAELHQLSDVIWNKPELNFQEFEAHRNITKFLEKKGFSVQKSYIANTAFRSDYGHGHPAVAILCEYDALPEIGHGCGHNLIAEAGVAASLGVKAVLDHVGLQAGKLVVLGTPAEEGGGGKIDLIDGGAFNDIDTAMMIHPYPLTITRRTFLAITRVRVRYMGKASHASGFPWEGVNALDAAVLAYNNISCLRQQMKPAWRVHGVIVNGGVKPNIIPEESSLDYYLRAPTQSELAELKDKAIKCFNAAANATGCKIEFDWNEKPYKEVIHNNTLCSLYESHLQKAGIAYSDPGVSGSSDMGNVSFEVPSMHPMFDIDANAATHSREFATAAVDKKAQPYTLQHAKLMARTAIDVMFRPEVLPKAKKDLQKDLLNH